MANRVAQVSAQVLALPTNAQIRVGQANAQVLAVPTNAQIRVGQANMQVLVTYIAPVHDISTYLRNAIIGHLFRSAPFAKPASLWIALYSLPPNADGGGTEVVGSGYSRIHVGPGDGAWNGPSAGNGIATNGIDFTFPTPSADWGNLVAWGIHDAAVGGNLLAFSTFSASTFVAAGSNPRFVAGSITVTFA